MQCWTIAVGGFSILNSLIKKLGVNGSKGTINLKTLHGVRSGENSISRRY